MIMVQSNKGRRITWNDAHKKEPLPKQEETKAKCPVEEDTG